MTDDQPSPQQMARDILAAYFDDDPGTAAVLDQLVAALDEAGILIDPVDNGMWQNLKAGHMTCRYENGQLLFRMTDAGTQHLVDMINKVAEP